MKNTIKNLVVSFFILSLSLTSNLLAKPKFDGGILVGNKEMTLYTFDKDTKGSGKSVCNGDCAKNWPPYLATDKDKAADKFTIVTRDRFRFHLLGLILKLMKPSILIKSLIKMKDL